VGNSLLGKEEIWNLTLMPMLIFLYLISAEFLSLIHQINVEIALVNYTFSLVKEVMELK
jgi:hypothetical protein